MTTLTGPPRQDRSSRLLSHCDPFLAFAVSCVKFDFERFWPSFTLHYSETYRPVAIQQKYFRRGRFGDKRRRITWVDGIKKKGSHNHWPSRAVDVYLKKNGKVTWKELYYDKLGPLCKKHGLLWGGWWKGKKKDRPHIYVRRSSK